MMLSLGLGWAAAWLDVKCVFHAVLKAFRASNDVVVDSSSGTECFSMVASDSPTRVRNRLAI